MKKIAALTSLTLLALLAGCNADRVDNAGTTTQVQACEKGDSCCKVTKNKADCKSDCGGADCKDSAGCEKKVN